ncbi:MAG: cysteine--tRNA ligase [Gammaproteobacteria bacterium]|nr:cysteine--tRNA ligase [Gammaproteobacteria bacterium]
MTIQIYNTVARRKEEFIPADPKRVTMYVCGPTVYSFPHIGNARPAVVFDVFYRLLMHEFGHVIYVRNITDVDDKINAAAVSEGISIGQISARYTRTYHQNMADLGVLPPSIEPKVTEHMPQIIDMIKRLIVAGNAYEAEGHVLFHVPSYHEYGVLSGRNLKELIAGARVDVAPFKKDDADFVLWKPSGEDQPAWDSPWGAGRPGWHIECSTMIEQHLGETIDIHGGGQDLIFPHHENERAQSTCAHHGKLFSRYWMHNGFVNVNHEKMSKSLGNILLVQDLLEQASGEAVRFTLLGTHYRSPLDWTDQVLNQSSRNLDRLYEVLQKLDDVDVDVDVSAEDMPVAFMDALKDDLNTPAAIAELHKLAKQVNTVFSHDSRQVLKKQLLAAGKILGILQQDPAAWFRGTNEIDEMEILALLEQRASAKNERDFKRADEIRNQLKAMGIQVQDRPDGTSSWRKA